MPVRNLEDGENTKLETLEDVRVPLKNAPLKRQRRSQLPQWPERAEPRGERLSWPFLYLGVCGGALRREGGVLQ